MTTLNAYATLVEYKAYATARGQTSSTDATDDTVIENILKAASRFFDDQTRRWFYPLVETRYYDVPDTRQLDLDADLLEVITLTNGDGTTIASTEYRTESRNYSPKWAIVLKGSSSITWEADSSGNTERVIAVAGIWGYHDKYNLAWLLGSTANEAMDASETGYDVTSGTGFAVGNLIRFDNELGYVSAVVTNTLTITRGENSSTAATHLTGINVTIWQVMDEVRQAVLGIALQAYKQRFGQSTTQSATVTAAGVVLTPKDVPAFAADTIRAMQRLV